MKNSNLKKNITSNKQVEIAGKNIQKLQTIQNKIELILKLIKNA
jgi:hypothetical protein